VLARGQIVTPQDVSGLGRYVFVVAVPVLLFNSMAKLALPAMIDWTYLLAYYLAAYLVYGLAMFIGRTWFAQTPREQGVFGLAAAYSNLLLVGLPIISAAFGPQGLVPALLIVATNDFAMALTISVLAEASTLTRRAVLAQVGRLGAAFIRNPIIVGLLLGLLINRLGLQLPGPLADTADLIARSALPCALFMLGAVLSQQRLADFSAPAWTTLGLKLLLQPALVALLLWLIFPVSRGWAAVAVVMAGMPTAVNVSIFAKKYEAYVAPVAAATLLTSLLVMVSAPLLLVFLRQPGP
jgi:predicted permease